MNTKEIIYFLPDSDEGVASIVRNILKYRQTSDLYYKVVMYSTKEQKRNSINDTFNVKQQIKFTYSEKENLYYVLKRLKKVLKSEESIIIANDCLELKLIGALKLKNPIVYIIHGDFDYYYQISQIYEDIIDKFIAYSRHIYEKLKLLLKPENRDKVKLIYYPSPEIKNNRKNEIENNQIKIIYVGLLTQRKGVNIFKDFVDELIKRKINFQFSIVGSGEEENKLKEQLSVYTNICFYGQLKNEIVLKMFGTHNILFFPTLSEGLPNVIVEAMKNYCVTITSNISSGIPDLIEQGQTGYLVEVNNYLQFADKVEELYNNRELLNKIAIKGKIKADEMFSINQANVYEIEIIKTNSKKDKKFKKYGLGRVLNKKYIPNILVKIIRIFIKHSKI